MKKLKYGNIVMKNRRDSVNQKFNHSIKCTWTNDVVHPFACSFTKEALHPGYSNWIYPQASCCFSCSIVSIISCDLLCVSWLKQHVACSAFGKPLQIWWKDLFLANMITFIPVQYILGKCACMDIKYEEQTVLLLCPVKNI